MAVKIRLQRKGKKKMPFYHIVIADSRAPRDGRFIEKIGTYNPLTKPATIDIDREKAFDWLKKGAQPTETVKAILRYKGVYYLKHVMLGVSKGAFTEEVALEKYNQFLEEKEAKINARVEKSAAERRAFHHSITGLGTEGAAKVVPKVQAKKVEPVAEEMKVETPAEPAVEAIIEVPAEPVVEATAEVPIEPVAETPAETPADEPIVESTEEAAPLEPKQDEE
jgi:small subunit ribosomal protein S16